MLEFFSPEDLKGFLSKNYTLKTEEDEVPAEEEEIEEEKVTLEEPDHDFVGGIACTKDGRVQIISSWKQEEEDEQFADKLGLWLYLLTSGSLKVQFIQLLHAEMARNPEFVAAVAVAWDKHRQDIENLPDVTSSDVFNE